MKSICWVFVFLALGVFSLSAQEEVDLSTEEMDEAVAATSESSFAMANMSPSYKEYVYYPCYSKVMPACDTACFGAYDCCSRMNYSFFYRDENICSVARSGSVFAPRSTCPPMGITLPIVKKKNLEELMVEGEEAEENCPDCQILQSLQEGAKDPTPQLDRM